MAAIRPFVSAAIVGLSAWCAAGTVTVATADSATLRLAALAEWWWLAGPALASLFVPGWRRTPLLTAPALLATLPWWPVPLPAAALIWTGPLAWMPLAVALAAGLAEGRGALRASSAAQERRPPSPHASTTLAALATFLLGLLTLVAVDPRTPGGDEPHYLVITQSLLADGDLRIENNHRDRDYAAYFGGSLPPDFIQRGRDGEIYSIHAPGVSVLVLPGFLAFGYRGAQATVLVLSALTGGLVWLLGWTATGRRDAAWFGWAGVTASSTFLLQAGMIFPDGPGALVVAVAVWVLLELQAGRSSGRALVLVGALLAGLPWLHSRLAVLAAGFGLAIVWMLRKGSRARARLASFLVVPVVSAAAWFGFFYAIYGTPNPAAPYGADSGARLAYVPGGVLGLLFDQQFGLIAYSPVMIFVFAAAGLAGRRAWGQDSSRESALVVLASGAIAAAYVAAAATYWMWWAGLPATPGRFLTAVLPVAAIPLALSWARADMPGRLVRGTVLGVSLAIAAVAIGVDRGGLAWNVRDARAQWLEWLGPLVNLPRAWPSFFWRLSPDDLSTEWPFAIHALAWLAVMVLAMWAAGQYVRLRRPGAARGLLIVGSGLAGAVMLATSVGWGLNGAAAVDPARSQFRLLAEVGEGRALWRITALAVAPGSLVDTPLSIRPEEPGRADAPLPAVFTGVPPGLYRLVGSAGASPGGSLAIRLGRSEAPLQTMAWPAGAGAEIWLPGGARVLTVESAEDPGAGAFDVALVARRLDPPVENLAIRSARYGDAQVFVADDGAFLEPDGLWVRGARSAELVIAPASGIAPVTLRLRNGASPNEVDLSTRLARQTFELAPWEERVVPLQAPGLNRGLALRVSSANGFRPSDDTASDDRRFLGVWVELVTDAR